VLQLAKQVRCPYSSSRSFTRCPRC
jgi:hypothetical protein